MNRKLRYYEKIGMLIAIIKNDYPSKISKDFSSKIMSSISSENNLLMSNLKFFKFSSLAKVASVFLFALTTVYILQFNDNKIKYTGTLIDKEYSHPTRNVTNQSQDCDNRDTMDSAKLKNKCN